MSLRTVNAREAWTTTLGDVEAEDREPTSLRSTYGLDLSGVSIEIGRLLIGGYDEEGGEKPVIVTGPMPKTRKEAWKEAYDSLSMRCKNGYRLSTWAEPAGVSLTTPSGEMYVWV
jgi:hypothetical protein